MKTRLASSPFGRIVLHLLCLACDGKLRWHLAGVMREMRHAAV